MLQYDPLNDLYTVLGVPSNATQDQVHQAFRAKAKIVHPDRNPDRQDWANEQFRRLNEAYDVLRDPDLRFQYDMIRKPFAPNDPIRAPKQPFTRPFWRVAGYDDLYARQKRWEDYISGVPRSPTARTSRRKTRIVTPQVLFALSLMVLFVNMYLLMQMSNTPSIPTPVPATADVNIVAAQPFRLVTIPPAMGIGNTAPQTSTCDNPNVTITFPTPGFHINYEPFTIQGSAYDELFSSFIIEVDALDHSDRLYKRWTLSSPVFDPVQNDALVRGVTIQNVTTGTFILRLRVFLTDGSVLPPCEVIIVRKV
jgi:hypothetical protein